ncbi:hypothetical protein VTK26DRAFT_5278 [Humicola hyalothermophila]
MISMYSMHAGALMGPSPHHLPRRLAGPRDGPALLFATHAALEYGSDESEVTSLTQTNQEHRDHHPEDEFVDDDGEYGDEDEGSEEEDVEEEEEEEEEEVEVDDQSEEAEDEDTEDEARLCYCGHSHPLHHPPAYYGNLDDYLSDDDLDTSDDNGATLVDCLANLLTTEMDMDSSADSGSDINPSVEDEPSEPDSAFTDDDLLTHLEMAASSTSVVTPASVPPPAPNPPPLPPVFAAPGPDPDDELFINQPPVTISITTTIGPTNYSLAAFLHHWARGHIPPALTGGRYPWPGKVDSLGETRPDRVRYTDLGGDACDFQGLNWEEIGVTREEARKCRTASYSNYVNVADSDRPHCSDSILPRNESFFRFRCMDFRRNIHLSHFQLRNIFAATSQRRVFYPTIGAVHQFNPLSARSRIVMRYGENPFAQVSALHAGHGILVAGGFNGEYMLRYLDSGEPENVACHGGTITINSQSGITNHVAVQQARTSSNPRIAFASNDNAFRVMDAATESWLSEEKFDVAPNCTALSPDRRLRVMVGDNVDVLITAAESTLPGRQSEVLYRLVGHRDYGFACDWADDGWTIATACQDRTVRIWDARWLADSWGNAAPAHTIRTEMATARSLRFSPIGSGKRVLVAAEESDFVNVIDAQTFASKQTLDVFGELGGVCFANDGQDLMVLCCDATHGGILQLERCNNGVTAAGWEDGGRHEAWDEMVWDDDGHADHHPPPRREDASCDWSPSVFTEERRVRNSASRRRRKPAADFELAPF